MEQGPMILIVMVVLVILVSSISSSSVLFVPSWRARIKDALGIESLQEQANCTTTTDKTLLLSIISEDKKCPPAKQSGVSSGTVTKPRTSGVTPPVGTSGVTPPVGTSGVTPTPPPPVGNSGVTPTPINLTGKCFRFSTSTELYKYRFTDFSNGIFNYGDTEIVFNYRTVSTNEIIITVHTDSVPRKFTVSDNSITSSFGIIYNLCPTTPINLTGRCFGHVIGGEKYNFNSPNSGDYSFGQNKSQFTYRILYENRIGITIGISREVEFIVDSTSIVNDITKFRYMECPASGTSLSTSGQTSGGSGINLIGKCFKKSLSLNEFKFFNNGICQYRGSTTLSQAEYSINQDTYVITLTYPNNYISRYEYFSNPERIVSWRTDEIYYKIDCNLTGVEAWKTPGTSGVTPTPINLTSRCFQFINNNNIKYRFTNTTNGVYIFGTVTTLNFTYRTITNNTIGITILSLQGVPQPEKIFTVS